MHNCKVTRERIAELISSGVESPQLEIFGCHACRAEFEALKATLNISLRAIESAAPAADYWNGYHARLRSKLETSTSVPQPARVSVESRSQAKTPALLKDRLLKILTASVRVPVPVALAILLLCGVAVVFAYRPQAEVAPVKISNLAPLEVPLIREQVITRVVYKEARVQSVVRPRAQPKIDNSTFAQSQPAPTILSGFRPMDDVKLTVIKGGSPDEK